MMRGTLYFIIYRYYFFKKNQKNQKKKIITSLPNIFLRIVVGGCTGASEISVGYFSIIRASFFFSPLTHRPFPP